MAVTVLLPSGVSRAAHASALEAFAKVLSADRVLTSPEDLREFGDPFEPDAWQLYVPSAVVMPVTVEEVQAVVRIANEHRIPLWTHGQGRNTVVQ